MRDLKWIESRTTLGPAEKIALLNQVKDHYLDAVRES